VELAAGDLHYAASGVIVNTNDVRLNVSPGAGDRGVVNTAENRKFPAVMLSHTVMCVSVSPDGTHVGHDGAFVIDFDPADAAPQVAAARVVVPDAAVVPAAPGSAVCSFTFVDAGAVNAVPPNMSSHLLAKLTACKPTATITPLHGKQLGQRSHLMRVTGARLAGMRCQAFLGMRRADHLTRGLNGETPHPASGKRRQRRQQLPDLADIAGGRGHRDRIREIRCHPRVSLRGSGTRWRACTAPAMFPY
jgi:hypothetical protein